MNIPEAIRITGGLTNTSKMPCYSYGIPASTCNVGGKLRREVKNSVCAKCYAHRGRYLIDNVVDSYYRRYKCVLIALDIYECNECGKVSCKTHNYKKTWNKWVEAMVYLINGYGSEYFRWFDSGDLLSVEHLEMIIDVVNQTPNVKHWLPTLEFGILNEYATKHVNGYDSHKLDNISNLVVRLSTPIIDGRPITDMAEKIGCKTSNVSTKKKELLSAFKENEKQAIHNMKINSLVDSGRLLMNMGLIRKMAISDGVCPAKMQDNSCNECRDCWDKTVSNVTYIQH